MLTNEKDLPIFDAFISYSRDDFEYAHALAKALRRRRQPNSKDHLKIFLDTDSINIGDNWITSIETAIARSKHIIPIYSNSYFASKAGGWELLQKLIADLTGSERSILPCLVEACAIPPRVQHINYLDFRGLDLASTSFLNRMEELASAIKGVRFAKPAEVNVATSRLLPDFPHFIYVSDTKVEMIESRPYRFRRAAEQPDGVQNRFARVSAAVRELGAAGQIGPLDGEKPFVSGDLTMKWGVVDWGVCDQDVRIAFFVAELSDQMILLAGSAQHLVGSFTNVFEFPKAAFGFSGSSLPGIVRTLGNIGFRIRSRDDVYLSASAICRGKLPSTEFDDQVTGYNFVEQRLTFVAKVLTTLSKPTEEELSAWSRDYPRAHMRRSRKEDSHVPADQSLDKDVLIASPLCVAISDNENSAR